MMIKELKITTVENTSKPDTEYIELVAKMDVDLNEFAILDRTFSEGKLSNVHRHFYQLPDIKLKKGEYIRIYTGTGKDKTGQGTIDNGKTTVVIYFRYWKMNSCIWNDDAQDRATIIRYSVVDGHFS